VAVPIPRHPALLGLRSLAEVTGLATPGAQMTARGFVFRSRQTIRSSYAIRRSSIPQAPHPGRLRPDDVAGPLKRALMLQS
jgi:hypothetical protein